MIVRFKSLISFVILTVAVAGCAATQPPTQIRGGIGADTNLDAIRPPSGATYKYAFETDDLPLPVALTLTSRRQSASRYDYRGALVMTLPDTENLAEITEIISQAFQVSGIRAKGNQVFIPVGMKTDNRFRSTSSNILLASSEYVPHDCFAQIGTCRYTLKSEGQPNIDLVSETTEKDGVWRTTTRADPKTSPPEVRNIREKTIYSIDKNAVIIDMVMIRSGLGPSERVVFRRR